MIHEVEETTDPTWAASSRSHMRSMRAGAAGKYMRHVPPGPPLMQSGNADVLGREDAGTIAEHAR